MTAAAAFPPVALNQRYPRAMATIQIRNVDDATYTVLRRRAEKSGRSLQEYLRLRLAELARPTFDEVVGAARAGQTFDDAPTTEQIVQVIREGRDD